MLLATTPKKVGLQLNDYPQGCTLLGGFLLHVRKKIVCPLLHQLAPLLKEVVSLIRAEDVAPHRVHQLLLRDEEVLLVLRAPVGEGGAHTV